MKKKLGYEKQLIKTAIESVECHVRGLVRSRATRVIAKNIHAGYDGIVRCDIEVHQKGEKREYENQEYQLEGLIQWMNSLLQIRHA